MRAPVYLPLMEELVAKGEKRALEAIGAMTTPEATNVLIALATDRNGPMAKDALTALLRRLPDPETRANQSTATRDRLVKLAWRDDMKASVLAIGWALLDQEDRASLTAGAVILQRLGGKAEYPKLMEVAERVLAVKEDPPTDPRVPWDSHQAAEAIVRAARALIGRGAEPPTDTKTPAHAALFLYGLTKRSESRPADSETTTLGLLKHPIPFIRVLAARALPRPLPPSMYDAVLPLFNDPDFAVVRAAYQAAESSKAPQFQEPLLQVLARSKETIVRWEVRRAAEACAAPRDRVLETLIEGIPESSPANELAGVWRDLIDFGGGVGIGGRSTSDPGSLLGGLKSRWLQFIAAHREQIRTGAKFKYCDPPLTRDMFPADLAIYPIPATQTARTLPVETK